MAGKSVMHGAGGEDKTHPLDLNRITLVITIFIGIQIVQNSIFFPKKHSLRVSSEWSLAGPLATCTQMRTDGCSSISQSSSDEAT